jgi:DNA-binding transcriptional LysR family regulator
MREAGSRARQIADALFAEHNCQPNIRMEMDSNDAIKSAVAAGFGIALLSQHVVDADSHDEALVLIRVEGLPIRHQWQLVYRLNKNLSDAEQHLVDELCEQNNADDRSGSRTVQANAECFSVSGSSR